MTIDERIIIFLSIVFVSCISLPYPRSKNSEWQVTMGNLYRWPTELTTNFSCVGISLVIIVLVRTNSSTRVDHYLA